MALSMTKECWLNCPELFEGDQHGVLGAFGDTAVDSPELTLEEVRQLDPELVASYEAYTAKRSETAKNCDENYMECPGRQPIVIGSETFLICPITQEPYHMPIAGTQS